MNIILKDAQCDPEIIRLYRQSFPLLELMPVSLLKRRVRQGRYHICGAYEGDIPVGLAFYVVTDAGVYLDFLAVFPDKRGNGYGGEILRLLKAQHPEKPLFLIIERPTDENTRRRLHFYQRNGFERSGTELTLFFVDFELLCLGGKVPFEAFSDAMQCITSPFFIKLFLHRRAHKHA